MSSTMVPFTGKQQSDIPENQDDYVKAMITAAARAKKTGRGADGTIETIGELVPRTRMWVDKNFPVKFSQEDIDTVRLAVLSTGKQENEIHVVKVENPAAKQRSHNGITDQDLLIVDIDGALLFKATAGTNFDQYRVVIEVYSGGYFNLLLRMGNAKSQQYTMRRVDKGLLYLTAKATYETEIVWRHEQGLGTIERFPSMDEIAPRFGCSSKSDLSLCVTMADTISSDADIALLADSGKISDDNLREIASAPATARLDIAQELAQVQSETGKPASRDTARNVIKLRSDKPARTPIPWNTVKTRVQVGSLWVAQAPNAQAQVPVPTLIGQLLHDTEFCLDEAEQDLPKEAQSFVAKLRALLTSNDARELMAAAKS